MKIFLTCFAMCIVLLEIASAETGDEMGRRSQPMVDVFIADGSLQCDQGANGVLLEDARKALEEEGVEVQSGIRRHDGKKRIAMCGAPTGQILIFTITAEDVPTAQNLGYTVL
jgi:hypothetical protein